ncbi:MAG: hypothetical protein NVSMB28_06800 [Collimonas sp.]
MLKKHCLQCIVLAVVSVSTSQYGFAQQSSAPSIQKRLGSLVSDTKEELLEPDEAFKLKVAFKGTNMLIAELIPANGYYLYKDKIRFTIKNPSTVLIGEIRLPPGEIKNDQFFGKVEIYKQPVKAEITLNRVSKAKDFTLVATYQGCNIKVGVCYSPIEKSINMKFP